MARKAEEKLTSSFLTGFILEKFLLRSSQLRSALMFSGYFRADAAQ